MVDFCRSCHTCQVSGKPNQTIPVAPLKPIPVMGEPFEHVIVDCVGPHIQSDQGSNFMSKIFAQVMFEHSAKHHTSSAYHPESQGALERFHQTLKAMLCKFCTSQIGSGMKACLFCCSLRQKLCRSLWVSVLVNKFSVTLCAREVALR